MTTNEDLTHLSDEAAPQVVKTPKTSKIMLLTLPELYSREKITPSVEKAIHVKEDFSKISNEYCSKVCTLKCKSFSKVRLLNTKLDILIVQDHAAPDGKFDRRAGGQEVTQKAIIEFIAQKAGFQGLNYRIVSLSKCEPNSTDYLKGKAPSSTVLSKCKPYLYEEIINCNPAVIISLSTLTTKLLGFPKHSNTGNRGAILEKEGSLVVVTLHPRVLSMIRQNASGKMWSADYMGVIVRDFKKAADLVRGLLIYKPLMTGVAEQSKNITICRSLPDIQNTVDIVLGLPEGAIVSCDLETSSLDGMADNAKILTIQFGWRDPESKVIVAHVIPLFHRENKAYNPNLAWKLVAPILLSENIPKTGHNFKFDVTYMYHTMKLRVRGIFADTMLLMHALSSGESGCYSLKTAVGDWLPEMGITGYEDLLPALTRKPKTTPEDEEEKEEKEEEEVVTDGED